MPMITDAVETSRILNKKSNQLSRYYGGTDCPFQIGETITLATPERNQYAAVKVKVIGDETFEERSTDERLAANEGFGSAEGWAAWFQSVNENAIQPTDVVHRIRFDMVEISEAAVR